MLTHIKDIVKHWRNIQHINNNNSSHDVSGTAIIYTLYHNRMMKNATIAARVFTFH